MSDIIEREPLFLSSLLLLRKFVCRTHSPLANPNPKLIDNPAPNPNTNPSLAALLYGWNIIMFFF